jgi:diguanylate cyclase (GGDEF)-like protein
VHDATRDLRDRSARQRRQTAQGRVAAAAARDAAARERDLVASERDRVATLHDLEFAARDATWASDGRAATDGEILSGAAWTDNPASAYRRAAAEARARAAADRAQAAADREQAARDRARAQKDREALLRQLAIAETDPLTGARTRGPGLADLDREVHRARRTTGQLVVAYIDVVGLKAVNDTYGHAAGDELLQHAVRVIRAQLRSYDLIMRIGGDEFLCALSGTTIEDASQRFDAVKAALAAEPDRRAIQVGFAMLTAEDDADALVQRADDDLRSNQRR